MRNTIETLENYLDHFVEQVKRDGQGEQCQMLTKYRGQMDAKDQISITYTGGYLATIRIAKSLVHEITASLSVMESGRRKVTVEASTNYLKDSEAFDQVVRDFAPTLDQLIEEFKTKYSL